MALTTTPTRPDGELSAASRQAAARAAWLDSHHAGRPLTGSQLGARFGRSRSWGNARIREARQTPPTAPAGTTTPTDQESDRTELANDRPAQPEPAATRTGLAPANVALASSSGQPAGDPATPKPSSAGQWIDTLVVAMVALVAAAASYEHQRALAELAGEGALAWVLPISVDGMMLATSRSILRRRRAGVPVPLVSWFGFVLGLAASIAANVAAAQPTLVGRLLAAWPPLALFIAYETLAADHGEFRR